MWLQLVTADDRLFALVQQVIGELSTSEWHLSAGEYDPSADIDLYLWDYVPGGRLPDAFLAHRDAFGERYRYVLLIDKDELPALHERFPRTDFSIVLKPATHASLGALLGQALAYHESMNSGAGKLRADRDELLQSLIQANLKLQEYDQDRTHFLARAAHDFRAPLTAITGYCGLLLEEALGPLQESQREVLQRVQHSSKRLSRLASGMFQLSINPRPNSRPVFEIADLRDCIEQGLCEVAQFTGEKQISVTLDYTPPVRPLYFDAGQLEQVIINLLENACKFTPRFGSIQIRAYPFFWDRRMAQWEQAGVERRQHQSHAPNSQRVDIIDNGPPIPAAHAAWIFEEYTSYGGAHDRSGAGLGLAICKMVLNRHNGAIWTDPNPQGASFSFVLPLHAPAEQRAKPNGQAAALQRQSLGERSLHAPE
jgi:signal transduction histidine kinase